MCGAGDDRALTAAAVVAKAVCMSLQFWFDIGDGR
jgi:hypothetical protein